MDNLRTICFVYNKNKAYEACYLKCFFKWTGFVYENYLYGSKQNIFEKPQDCTFDIIVNIDHAMPGHEWQGLEGRTRARLVGLDTDGREDKRILSDLVARIKGAYPGMEGFETMEELAEIYGRNRLVELLYFYTFVLLRKMEPFFAAAYGKKLRTALGEVEDCIKRHPDQMVEYALFAKYYCQKLMNDIRLIQKTVPEFPVDPFLKSVNGIYGHDPGFLKAEYLKAKVAEQNCMYNSFARLFLEDSIALCPVDVCKSYFYYSLGKWKENHKEPYEAAKAYDRSFAHNQNNIRAIFKIAVEQKRTNELELEKKFLWKIIDVWTDEDPIGGIPPMEIEYAYKVRMLMSEIVDPQQKKWWEDAAGRYMRFLDRNCHGDGPLPGTFFEKLYHDDRGGHPAEEKVKAVCQAMRCRLSLKCNEFFFPLARKGRMRPV